MNRILKSLLLSLLLSSAPALADDALRLDEILQRHIAARGGYEAIKAIQTLVHSNGTYREPTYEGSGDAFMAHARPYYKVVGNPENRRGFSEGYDGGAWEWYQNPGVVVRTVGAAAAAARHGNRLDGSLVDYSEKGSTASLGQITEIDGRSAYQVTITARDGFARDYFIDAETYLVTAERMSAPIHAFGEPVTGETRVGDYRPIAGVLFAHRYSETNIATGEMLSEMQWGKIEANHDLPQSWFSPPVFERTPLQSFVEQLYFARSDVQAIEWTYAEFRQHHTDTDTGNAVEFVGYQMLKMKNVEQAVRLLTLNAGDHPDSASAAFGRGRALAMTEDTSTARTELERALTINPEHRGAARTLRGLD
jgi:hypothetical protein